MRIVNCIVVATIYVLTSIRSNEVEREITLGEKTKVVVHVGSEMGPSLEEMSVKNGFKNLGRVSNPDPMWDGYYVLEGNGGDAGIRDLECNGIEHIMTEKMVKRTLRFSEPKDPLWMHQWNLRPRVDKYYLREYENINQLPAWGRGYMGKGVVVGIVDEGVDYDIPEIAVNYLSNFSFDYTENDSDPHPHNFGAHGTNCAGVIAAASDAMCGVGIAPDANIAAIKIFKYGEDYVFTTDMIEAMALSHALQHIDIFSNSWGPVDTGSSLGGPGILTRKAIEAGLERGRGGKGSIYVWAAGNGRVIGDNCGSDGFTQLVGSISVTSLTADGRAADKAEGCGAVLITAYSSGESYQPGLITSPSKPGAECNTRFGDTSGATAVISGVIALMLEANPSMGWRDVQHVLVNTARKADPSHKGWKRNAAGYWFNEQFGFGLVNAFAAANRARVWENVGEWRKCTQVGTIEKNIWNNEHITMIKYNYSLSNCSDGGISYLEHVGVKLVKFASANARGGWRITLVSPALIESVLFYERSSDHAHTDYQGWMLTSSNFWGENPEGEWTLRLEYVNRLVHNSSIEVKFLFYGLQVPPHMRNAASGKCGEDCVGKCSADSNECDECVKYYNEATGLCTDSCRNEGEIAEQELKFCRRFRDTQHPEVHLKKGEANVNVYVRYNSRDMLLCTSSIPQNFADRVCNTMDYLRAESIHSTRGPIGNASIYATTIKCTDITWETQPYECFEDNLIESSVCDTNVWEIKCTSNLHNNCTYPQDPILNGRYITERGVPSQDELFANGSKLFISCNKGYATEGSVFLTCVNGQWDSEAMCRLGGHQDIYLDRQVSALSYGQLTYYVMEQGSLVKYSVCYDDRFSMWDEKNGLVACRQLGYNGFDGVMGVSTYNERKYLKISFECSGRESLLRDCSYFDNKLIRCTQRVALNCSDTKSFEQVDLTNGANFDTSYSMLHLYILLLILWQLI